MKFYYINSDVEPDKVFPGVGIPYCMTANAIYRAAAKQCTPDLMLLFHEATPEEIDEHGAYEDEDNLNYNTITIARNMRKLTQTMLAKLIGIDPLFICKWEGDRGYPNKEYAKMIADVLDVDERWITREPIRYDYVTVDKITYKCPVIRTARLIAKYTVFNSSVFKKGTRAAFRNAVLKCGVLYYVYVHEKDKILSILDIDSSKMTDRQWADFKECISDEKALYKWMEDNDIDRIGFCEKRVAGSSD